MFNPFKKQNKTSQPECETKKFFAVLLGDNVVQAALWETDQNVKVLEKSQVKDFIGENDLLVKLDQALQELGSEGEVVHQTLFYLDSAFVNGQEIVTDRQALFAKLTEALQLESLGFVTNTEGVVNAKLALSPDLGKQLVVEFVGERVLYSLYDQKILLENLELKSDENWPEQLKGVLVKWAGLLGQDYSRFFEKMDTFDSGAQAVPPLYMNIISTTLTTGQLQEKIAQLPVMMPLRVEVLGSDILLSFILIPSANLIARSYGWLPALEEEPPAAPASVPPEPPAEVEPMPVLSRQKNFTPPPVEESDFTPITETTDDKVEKVKVKKTGSKKSKKVLIVWLIILLLLVALAGGFWWWLQQVEVLITLVPAQDKVPKNFTVQVDPQAKNTDLSGEMPILQGEIEVETVTTELPYTTTGTKQVGEKAKGKVELINKRMSEHTVKAGTEVENGSVSFIVNETVTLPPAQEDANTSGKTYSKKEVGVTALNAGSTGNIKSGTSLRVGSAVKEDLEAVAVGDFSGGTDKTVQVFSAEDEKAATSLAADELQEQASQHIKNKAGGIERVPQLDKIEVTEVVFDKKVGDEANSVTMTITGEVPMIVFDRKEVRPVAQQLIEMDIPDNYVPNGDMELGSVLDEVKTAAGSGVMYISVTAEQPIIASLDVDKITKDIAGQNLTKVNHYLAGLKSDGLTAYDIIWSNDLAKKIRDQLPSDDRLKVTVGDAPADTKQISQPSSTTTDSSAGAQPRTR